MTFTFGGVLPTGIGSVLLLVFAVIYMVVRPAIIFVAARIAGVVSPNK